MAYLLIYDCIVAYLLIYDCIVVFKYTIHTLIECFSRLVDTLEVFLERNGLPEIKHFRDEFPDSITLAQSVAVWKHIVSKILIAG